MDCLLLRIVGKDASRAEVTSANSMIVFRLVHSAVSIYRPKRVTPVLALGSQCLFPIRLYDDPDDSDAMRRRRSRTIPRASKAACRASRLFRETRRGSLMGRLLITNSALMNENYFLFWSPRSPSPFFTMVFAFTLRSAASDRPTSSLSLNSPALVRLMKRLSPVWGSKSSRGMVWSSDIGTFVEWL